VTNEIQLVHRKMMNSELVDLVDLSCFSVINLIYHRAELTDGENEDRNTEDHWVLTVSSLIILADGLSSLFLEDAFVSIDRSIDRFLLPYC
jgi:hypothetical protein